MRCVVVHLNVKHVDGLCDAWHLVDFSSVVSEILELAYQLPVGLEIHCIHLETTTLLVDAGSLAVQLMNK